MQWSEIRFDPSRRELRQFAGLCLLGFGALAGWHFARGDSTIAAIFAALAVGLGGIGLAAPRVLRPIYVGWMIAVFPIGWTVSKILLAIVYYGLFTPIGLVFRAIRRDALQLKEPTQAGTFWRPKPMPKDVRRYFRQY